MITVVTGGARCGKSDYAEAIYKDTSDVCYIATSIITDDEMKERVRLHRERRNPSWRTYEAYKNIINAVGDEKNYLLDCVTLLISNIMFEICGNTEINDELAKMTEKRAMNELTSLIYAIKKEDKNLVIVTNELGSGIVPENKISRYYRDIAGRVNRKITELADKAVLIVMGCEVVLK
ncbi:MAG: bifunctional adenosylcobinamide kinase/adenosylcobinamide-phosphate guanylyltransferase [Ezakiella sp.]|nr:bifunctional adenosylcobinamide kinase/adenosylcobinamide-phosphate guanylyltransferase [Bacillota bacterium]MDY3946471.1 bifunctional adenosylcobinamide kinase/adenosylcobinamide-phosphate guanylyltransferase [Ezakiella sp.]